MTVEVIKPADPASMFIKICDNCAVTLRYVRNDIYSWIHYDYGGGSDTYYMIRCPACLCMNDVKEQPLVDNKWKGKMIGGRGYLPGEEIPKDKE